MVMKLDEREIIATGSTMPHIVENIFVTRMLTA